LYSHIVGKDYSPNYGFYIRAIIKTALILHLHRQWLLVLHSILKIALDFDVAASKVE
jgi:hypothetical protein